MKTFLINKMNYLLSILLVGVLGASGVVGYNLLIKDSKVTVPDFLGKNKQEVFTWCGQLSDSEACEFVYEDTSNTEKDKVFQQSVSAGNKLEGKITFKISSGIVVQVNAPVISENMTKQDIENWKTENSIATVNYIEENSNTVEKGNIIRIEPSTGIKKDTVVTVYISAGKKDDSSNAEGKIEVKSGAYINLTESQFIAKAKELGLNPNHRTSSDSSSASVTKGNIVWHGSGTYEKGETINYGLCTEEVKGITVKEGAYVGKTEAEFKTIAEGLKLKAVHNSDWDEQTSDSSKAGKVCRHGYSNSYAEGENLRYGLYKLKSDSDNIVVKEDQYVGKTESEFKTIAEGLKLKAVHNSDWDEQTTDSSKAGTICKHGYSNNYVEGENLRYGLYKLKSGTGSIVVSQGQYVGKTESEFKTIASELGLKANHDSGRDAYSSTVAKNSIITHGYGTYVKDETFNYGLSLGPEGGSTSTDIIVKAGQYIGKSESEFKTIASDLGLKANHKTTLDAYSSTVAKGNVVWHGSGTYVKDEAFNYGLSLGAQDGGNTSQSIQISSGQYVGKSEADVVAATKALGLTPTHVEGRDAYSSTVPKGNVVTHGYGSYVKDEAFKYGLSLGAEPVAEKVTVESKSGSTEAEFKTYIEGLGLKLGTKSEAYSSTIAEGKIISNDTGSYTKGSSINYTVSKGVEPEKMCVLNGFSDLASEFLTTNDYEGAKTKATNYLNNAGFTNYSIVGAQSRDDGAGTLISVTVNGINHLTRATYPASANIVVTISTGYTGG